jgi:hypothetical protein
MKANDQLSMGIIVERRDLDNRWEDYSWHPVAIIPGAAELENAMDWRLMREGEGWSQFHIGTLALELFRGETEGYRSNLSSSPPQIYVVLSRGEEADEPDVVPFLITACPYEAESYMESGEEIVEGVVMPPEIASWIEAFVEEHHVDQPFKKRKQKKAYDPRKGGFAKKSRVQENGDDRG